MKFKVGDKVKAVRASYGWGDVSEGEIGEIVSIGGGLSDCDYIINFKSQADWEASESDLELAEPKKTKNQRITALEKEVAELKIIVEELRGHKTIDFSPLVEEKPKSANQKRAEIIEKAKKFVEENKYFGAGSNWNEIPFCQNVGHVDSTIYVNEKKRTIVAVVRSLYNKDKKYQAKGIAKCHPSDVFNEHIGKAIALGRALGLDVSEFEQAVQPNEAVEGTFVHAYRKNTDKLAFSHTTKATDKHLVNRDLQGKGGTHYAKIINDTNAIY